MWLSILLQNCLQWFGFRKFESIRMSNYFFLPRECGKSTYSHCAAVGGEPAPSPAPSQPVSVQPESPVANSPRSAAAPPHAAL